MIKRLLAWIAVIGFIFLIANLVFFKYNIILSTGIYGLIILIFVLSTFKSK